MESSAAVNSTASYIMEHSWLIAAVPLISFILVGLFVRPRSDKWSGIIATGSLFLTMVCAYVLAWEYFHFPSENHPTLVPWSVKWMEFMPGLIINFGVLVDSISVMMMTVVTTVSFLVHLYSIGYMRGEAGYGRYFTYLNLFTFSMLGLVSAPNIFQMYVFWELVGVSSFLLIGFYYQKPAAVAASKKAFIVTRFADLGFLIGILILGYFGYQFQNQDPSLALLGQPLDFSSLTHPGLIAHLSSLGVLNLALILVFVGAAGKSAMFPLHIWLPDAMEGPTPVSALIHAATMVVAGVYLVARLFPMYSGAPAALEIIAAVGLLTSAFAAIIACTQEDIKRVLAFSTLSQLGYMMFSLGIASLETPLGFTASMFHLYTHAFFKALLFLGAGAVIHATHTNNLWEMGGLKTKMPVTHVTFFVAVLAISGIWPFAGFFSKDEILTAALNGHMIHFFGGLFVAGLTAFYMARVYFLTFWGKSRAQSTSHAHEANWFMLIPLVILSLFSCITGFIPFGHFVSVGLHQNHGGLNLMVAIPSTLVASFGLLTSWYIYGREGGRSASKLSEFFGGLFPLVKNKFYFDELYLFITYKIIFRFVAAPIAWFDRHIIDGGVNLTGWSARQLGTGFLLIQNGDLQTYGIWFVLGPVFIFILYWLTVS